MSLLGGGFRLDEFLFEFARHFFIPRELLGMHAAAGGQRTDYARVAIKLLGRDFRFHDLKLTIAIDA